MAPCGEVRQLIEVRLQAIRNQIEELGRLRGTLEEGLETCLASDPLGNCAVVDNLRHGRGIPATRKENEIVGNPSPRFKVFR